ncbi:MAG: NAD(+) synthase [Bacteroidota bacterium]
MLTPNLDCAAETQRIEQFIRHTVARTLNRRGAVLGVSGGVDSAVCAALAARAVGAGRVKALLMPEREASDDGRARAERLCRQLEIPYRTEDITAGLVAVGCYSQRDEAIRKVFPAYGPGWRNKIALAGNGGGTPWFNLVVESPAGERMCRRMPHDVYLQVVAANNWKQRLRKGTEYYHAERLNYAVIGTPNRLEYALGFFVRGGDGLADLKPIAHLYKTQVYALAEYLGVPEEIRSQLPSTDTYSLPQTQEEFYFALPYGEADHLLHSMDAGIDPGLAGEELGLKSDQVNIVWRDFAGKQRLAQRTLREAITIEDES